MLSVTENRNTVLDEPDPHFSRYDEQLEDLLDHAYEQYVTRKGGTIKKQNRGKKTPGSDAELLEV